MRSGDRVPSVGVSCEWDGDPRPVANLSLGGFFVAAQPPLPVGQVVALRLRLPERTLTVQVKVAWQNEGSTPRNPGLPTGFGVAIKRIDLADKLALVEFLRTSERASTASRPALR